MHLRPNFLLSLIVPLIPAAAIAAPSTNLNHEYEQVRLIALRDPKVKAAFEAANQKLEQKIVEIDPAIPKDNHSRQRGSTQQMRLR